MAHQPQKPTRKPVFMEWFAVGSEAKCTFENISSIAKLGTTADFTKGRLTI